MSKTLITFLGRVPPERGNSYRKTTYDFGATRRDAPFFGSALAEEARVDRLRILGTAGSMWDVLAFELHEHMNDALNTAVRADAVTQEMLNELEIALNATGKRQYQLRLVPYGYNEEKQVDILKTMSADFRRGDEVLLDITHALRHLPMLGLLSAFYLQAVVQAKVTDIYYAAFDLAENGITPVVKLDGLLRIYDWLRAMEQFNKDGDYGAFGALLTREGLPGKLLTDAAYLERTANAPDARRKLDSFAQSPQQSESAAGALFLPLLKERISWRQGRSRSAWEASLAREYLARRDYVRAAEFGYESTITAQIEATGGDDDSYDVRKSADEQLADATRSQRQRPGETGNFMTLKNLRNSLAHGTRSDSGTVRDLIRDEGRLAEWLEKSFAELLPK
ncbi:MAG: TIGR02221 family CRISPR-associated protein [Sulfurisoma sp.]|nr:TIGR02221 family CRISPR-associated protein [Sulfurisoma sp.]